LLLEKSFFGTSPTNIRLRSVQGTALSDIFRVFQYKNQEFKEVRKVNFK
jgi:hypothetical protein